MRHVARPILILVGLMLLAAPTAFAQLRDLEEGKDHPMVSRYAGSIILGYDAREFDEFVLPLGPLERSDELGVVVNPTQSQRVEGRVTRIVYVAPENRSPLEVLRNYEQELKKAGFQTLYSCARVECGVEDGVLSQYYLYGDDRELSDAPPGASGVRGQITEFAFNFPRDQRYLAAKLARPEGDVYASVYVATETFDHFPETKDHALVLLDVIETRSHGNGDGDGGCRGHGQGHRGHWPRGPLRHSLRHGQGRHQTGVRTDPAGDRRSPEAGSGAQAVRRRAH